MGGDFGPRVTVRAALDALKRHPELKIILAGPTDTLSALLLPRYRSLFSRIEICHSDIAIGMDEKPSMALRHGRDSSMGMALQMVADKRADACISAGNTGALMALGRSILGTIPGVDRPAITAAIPTLSGHSFMLDLGANVECSAEQLLQFAIMGSELASVLDPPNGRPSIGLLNVGTEENKGTDTVQTADRLISEYGELNYIGYVEGNDLFSGRADVVVCDGFVGNIALKCSEGLSRLIIQRVRSAFRRGLYGRLLAVLAAPVLASIRSQLDPGVRNGATLLGLNGVVIKSHGGASRRYFGCAIEQALNEARLNVPHRIGVQVTRRIGSCSSD